MKNILTLNSISPVINDIFDASYKVENDAVSPIGIMLRSFKMHDYKLDENTIAIARAGAGTNNIPVEEYAKQGVVVFNTPGANANAVKELVLCGLFLSSRRIPAALDWCKTLKGEGDNVGKLVLSDFPSLFTICCCQDVVQRPENVYKQSADGFVVIHDEHGLVALCRYEGVSSFINRCLMLVCAFFFDLFRKEM